jgi:hypothetical protein
MKLVFAGTPQVAVPSLQALIDSDHEVAAVVTRPDARSGRGRKVALFVPQRGPRVDLLKMANENAAHAFREKQRSSDDLEARLEELRERLRLPTLPRRTRGSGHWVLPYSIHRENRSIISRLTNRGRPMSALAEKI